jgi:hypothetical protein
MSAGMAADTQPEFLGPIFPLGARVLAVVDCFDALNSDRPYRPRLEPQEAFEILRERRGTMYDPLVVDTFIAAYPEIAPLADAAGQQARTLVDTRKNSAESLWPVRSRKSAQRLRKALHSSRRDSTLRMQKRLVKLWELSRSVRDSLRLRLFAPSTSIRPKRMPSYAPWPAVAKITNRSWA